MMHPLSRPRSLVLRTFTVFSWLMAVPQAHSAPPMPGPAPSVDDPERARGFFQEGSRLMHDADFDAACTAFRQAAAASPLWALARFELAQCFRIRGYSGDLDPLEELAEAERSIRKPVIHIERARLLEDRGQNAAAFASWMHALDMLPSEVRAIEGAARTASALPLPGGASVERDRIKAWLNRQPQDVAAWVRLGELAERRGDLAEAESAFIEAGQRSADRKRGAALVGLFATRTGSRTAADKAQQILHRR